MYGIFKPAPHVAPVPDERMDSHYRMLRWRVFLGIFIGYAGYYLVRKNFSLAMPFLIEEQGFSKGQLGIAMSAVSIAYGLSKFLMGTLKALGQLTDFGRFSSGLGAKAPATEILSVEQRDKTRIGGPAISFGRHNIQRRGFLSKQIRHHQ